MTTAHRCGKKGRGQDEASGLETREDQVLTLSRKGWGHSVEGGGVCRRREGGGEAAKSRHVPIALLVAKLTGQGPHLPDRITSSVHALPVLRAKMNFPNAVLWAYFTRKSDEDEGECAATEILQRVTLLAGTGVVGGAFKA